MAMSLESSRLCLDCDTVFDEAQCPSCGSESYFPLSRWVRPAREALEVPARPARKTVKKTSLVLGGAGVAYALWKLWKHSDGQNSGNGGGPREDGGPSSAE
jgi:hypothetical protein